MLNNAINVSLLVDTLKDKGVKASNGYKFKGLTASDFRDASNPNWSLYRDAVEVYRVQMFEYSNDLSDLSNRDLDSTMKRALSYLGIEKEELTALIKKVGSHKHFIAKRYGQTLTEEGRALIEEVRTKYADKSDELTKEYNEKYATALHSYGVINETELNGENAEQFAQEKAEFMADYNAKKEALEKAQTDEENEIRSGAVWTDKAFRDVSPSTFRKQFEHAISDLMLGIALADKIEVHEFVSAEQWAKIVEKAREVGVKKPVIQKMKDTKNYSGLQDAIKKTREENKAKKKAKAEKATK